MDKKQQMKNLLDLEYHGESQKASVFLTLSTVGLLTFLGTFIFLRDNELFVFGLFITLIILLSSLIIYNKKSNRMKEILTKIKNIK